ncbi:aminoglycoside phosphotransferase family protein [Deinococcus apachensis]|uniref:aminoglycoside phosphotransferase family protein n=1 Tax=Deinococcus apachensis TaxID=309886 RepID=UPI00035EF6FA|nr:aminoglycoside phosphotransferase family protein [Deinococcus apachensis]
MMFGEYLRRWNLTPDGDPIHTHSSDLLPVKFAGEPAMLKLPRGAEERFGGLLMLWWNGDGAARVLDHDEATGALVLERVTGPRSLVRMVHEGQDDGASRILCAVAARLHAPRPAPLPELVPLETWFRALEPASRQYGGILVDSASAARHLLAAPQDLSVLHGDLHHENVLDGGPEAQGGRGWLAIDPKRLLGERGFDHANIFCNPDLKVAAAPGRLARQAHVVAEAAGLDRGRLLQWVLAYAGLSVSWWLEDGRHDEAEPVLEVARIAAAELRRA